MRNRLLMAGVSLALSYPTFADDIGSLKQQLDNLKQDYEQRVQTLENRLKKAEDTTQSKPINNQAENSFNPAISLILDGRYTSFSNDPDGYKLPGFMLDGEAGLGEEGFSLGHTELAASANIDDKFYGKATLAIHEHDGSTEVELEEAFIQTIGLGNGINVKAGRFFSAMGYLNEQHEHAWDFADAPLIYRGLFGNQLRDDGLQISYLAPTDTFLQFGVEALKGSSSEIGAWTAFANIGGDIGVEHSWLLGLSHWQADDIERTSGGHSHGDEHEEHEEHDEENHEDHEEHEEEHHMEAEHDEHHMGTPSFSGENKIIALDFVYKWAPNGNPKYRNFKFQFEYFKRTEDGTLTLLDSDPLEATSYDGDQSGWYAQAVYQFIPQWRTGLRYDQLNSGNSGFDVELLEEAGLSGEDHTPRRYSLMLEWLPSEFSRIRLQFNRDESYTDTDNQVFLQYTYSLGSHGSHQF
ncbi:hypothetical protein QUF74_01805 [Candidatus Halobeggiatoa sp. HSG11]|nr:hypothetical protein [Candidatus Halobeggiatoa sp. HSG11]